MLGPWRAGFKAGRDVQNVKPFIWDKLYKHLQLQQSHAQMLFADFSSAFNTVPPQKGISNVSLRHDLALWIVDFLTNIVQQAFVNMLFSTRTVTCIGPPRSVLFLTSSTLCIQMTAAVTKRAVTWLSLPIAVFYFFSVWEHKMVTVQPSMTLQKGLTSRTFTWMWTKLKRRWLISGDRGILTGRSRYMMKRWKQSIGINTSERSLRTPSNGILTLRPSQERAPVPPSAADAQLF